MQVTTTMVTTKGVKTIKYPGNCLDPEYYPFRVDAPALNHEGQGIANYRTCIVASEIPPGAGPAAYAGMPMCPS
jgi:hypothetical protein